MVSLYDSWHQRFTIALAGSDRAEESGDLRLNPGMFPPDDPLPAAVLIPVLVHGTDAEVLLTQRTEHLKDHAGQVAFPGGRFEPTDGNLTATALREAEEEIGLPVDLVEVVNTLPLYITATGFAITPVVGLIKEPVNLKPGQFEVAEIFRVPLTFLLSRESYQLQSRSFLGHERFFYQLDYEGRNIWGATAGILYGLCQRMSAI